MTAVARAVLVALVCGGLVSPAAAATTTKTTKTTTTKTSAGASQFYITGGGFGHGVGMSQYGAAGYALHGYTYERILAHYYSGTTLGKVQPDRTVTVLLDEGAASFRGASTIEGVAKKLLPGCTYRVILHGSKLRIVRPGHLVGTFAAPVTVYRKNGSPLTLNGQGTYDGALIFRPDGKGSVMTVNAVPLEAYVRGVVPSEMPSGWPAPALEAQAVAARTYAIAAPAVDPDFDVYDNTHSQVYGGVNAEKATSNAAVDATSGEVVEYDGRPVTTYFFSSSGGYTESVQNVWPNLAPEPWLRGVPDPYDDAYGNPYTHWTVPYSLVAAEHKLHGLYAGTLEGIKVTQTGVSPRVVRALVVGTHGSSAVTGTQLQRLFATRSTDMSFTTLAGQGERTRTVVVRKTTRPVRTATGDKTSPASPPGRTLSTKVTRTVTFQFLVKGAVYPVKPGLPVTAQLAVGAGWRSVARARLTRAGDYEILVKAPGTYRTVYAGLDGPDISVP